MEIIVSVTRDHRTQNFNSFMVSSCLKRTEVSFIFDVLLSVVKTKWWTIEIAICDEDEPYGLVFTCLAVGCIYLRQ